MEGNKEDMENYRLISPISIPQKVMEQILLEIVSKHNKDKNVTGSSQLGFTKGKNCLINLIDFYSQNTGFMDERSCLFLLH